MAEPALVREKMRTFMDRLSPAARAMLDRRRLVGGRSPLDAPPARSPAERFEARAAVFAPYAAFVVDVRLARRQPGWIERDSLEGIWTYACRELLPELLGPWREPRSDGPVGAARDELVGHLGERLFVALAERRVASDDDPHARQRFVSRLGGETAFADLLDLFAIRARGAALDRLLARLPAASTVGEVGDRLVVDCILEHLAGEPGDATLVAAALANRISSTSTLVNVAVALARSTVVDDIRRTPGALFIDAAISVCERQALGFRRAGSGAVAIQRFHEALRGIATIVDLSGDSRWLKRLADIRRSFSEDVAIEIERLVPALRVAFHLASDRTSSDEAAAVADELAAIYGAASTYRDCLALNELLARVRPVAEQAVQLYGDDLSRRLREQDADGRPDARRVFDRFLSVAARVHGDAYASFLRRGVGALAASPPKVPAKAN